VVSKKRHDLRAGDGFVLRTPLLPLTSLLEWASGGDVTRARAYLAALVARPEVEEALFVASPSLHDALPAWRAAPESAAGQRAELSIARYVARMVGRATPFGLFAGVTAGKLGRETRLALAPTSEYRRRTRLDNDYLFVLADALVRDPAIRARLTYQPNSSMYRIAGQIRYAAALLSGAERRYHLVSADPTPYLDATLERAAHGARPGELATALVDNEITLDEASAYIAELIEGQLLLPDLGVYVTGPEPIDGFLAQLAAAELSEPRVVLDGVRAAIAAIDAHGVGNAPDRYRAVETSLQALPAKVDPARLFQVDMVKPASATLDARVAAELARAMTTLASISRSPLGAALDEFRNAFVARWEDREVPLVEVLDEESGIGFEVARGPGSEGSPLLADLGFPGRPGERTTSWGAAEHHKLRWLSDALAAGQNEIVLSDDHIGAIQLATPAELPDAFAVMFRIAGTADDFARREPLLFVEGMSGPSGARLLGRFCHASPEIEAMVRAHHAIEEAVRPGAIYAEIVHLNEGRIGNILCRPVLRAHEIAFLGFSGAPRDHQIGMDDLLVSVRDGRIALRSRRLGREVIPRLSTAHNYRLRSMGVYRFLCSLAGQGVDATSWSWGALGGAPFLPRIRLGNVILSRATWNMEAKDLAGITTAVRATAKTGGLNAANRAAIAKAVHELRTTRRLPRFLVIASGDNELPIDLENPLLVGVFADEVSGAGSVQLCELLPAPDQLVVEGPEGRFTNELIVTFTRTRQPAAAIDEPPTVMVRRSFGPASEWLYAKIYTGESTTDRVLRDAIAPFVRDVLGRGDASHWFFLRYRDPDTHLRVRIAGAPDRLISQVLPALERAVAPLIALGSVRKLVLDSYDREVERYGGDHGIELVERVFWRDSEAALGIVQLLDGDAGSDARWRLALRGIDTLFTTLGLDAEACARIAEQSKERLGREHNANTAFWARVGDRFAKLRASLEPVVTADPERDAAHDLSPGFELLAARNAALTDIVAELRARDAAGLLRPKLEAFAWSLAHMHANRLLRASHRAHELVLYEFLRRFYASRKGRRTRGSEPIT
jgi:thiopeptide-type bacteriocin biosynthesis protein